MKEKRGTEEGVGSSDAWNSWDEGPAEGEITGVLISAGASTAKQNDRDSLRRYT